MRKNIAIVCLLFAVILAFTACDNSLNSGSLIINFSDSIGNERAIKPNIPLDINRYQVRIVGTNYDETITINNPSTSYSKKDIPAGSYTISVDALNINGTIIGTGSSTADITQGQTAQVSIVINEVQGEGTLSVTLTGNVDKTKTYTLHVYNASDKEIGTKEFTSNEASLSLNSGTYYFKVTNNGGFDRYIDAFRIVKGDTIAADVNISNNGSIQITCTNNIKPNPSLSFALSKSIVYVGESVVLTAQGFDNASYIWLVDGEVVKNQNSSSITLTKDIAGEYVIKCIAKDTANNVVWSAEEVINIYSHNNRSLTVSGDVEFWVIGDVLTPQSMNVELLSDGNTIYSFDGSRSHRSFMFNEESTISCNILNIEGYTYYLESETANDGHTVIYIVIDKEMENPAYIRVIFDYDYIFDRGRNEFSGFYLSSTNEGRIALTNKKEPKVIKVAAGHYREGFGTGSNCPIRTQITPSEFTLSQGETKELIVKIPYATVKIENFNLPNGYYTLQCGNSFYNNMYVANNELILPEYALNANSYALWQTNNPEFKYTFEGNIKDGESKNVQAEKINFSWIKQDITIPAGRVLVNVTSNIALDKHADFSFNWKVVGDNQTIYGNIRRKKWFNFNNTIELYLLDILNLGYNATVTQEALSDSSGPYTKVTINLDKDMTNYATLRILPRFDESCISSQNAFVHFSDQILLIFTAEPYDLKIEPGTYRKNGWAGSSGPNGTSYNPKLLIDEFTCQAGETKEIEIFLEPHNH